MLQHPGNKHSGSLHILHICRTEKPYILLFFHPCNNDEQTIDQENQYNIEWCDMF